MPRLFNLSIKSRLLLVLLPISLLSILIIGFLSWQSSRNALEESIQNQLTSIRVVRTNQIRTYFKTTFSHLRTLAENRMIVQAMENLQNGYQEGLEKTMTPEEYQAVTAFYEDAFLPRLSENTGEPAHSVLYRPQRVAASFFSIPLLLQKTLSPWGKNMN